MPYRCPGQLTSPFYRLSLALVLACGPGGCTGRDILFNGGGAVGEAALEERGVGGAYTDASLRLSISQAWLRTSLSLFQRLHLLISRGDVVMVGRVRDDLTRFQAELLARDAGAHRLRNAITVGPDLPLKTRLQDKLTANRLEMALTLDRDIAALNYQAAVSDGVVYLAGEARDADDFNHAHALAASLSHVRKVESYVHLPGHPVPSP